MHNIRPLPQYLVGRFHGWRATSYSENSAWYRRLATDGYARAETAVPG